MEVFVTVPSTRNDATQDLAGEFWSVFGGPAGIIAARVSSPQTRVDTRVAALAPRSTGPGH